MSHHKRIQDFLFVWGICSPLAFFTWMMIAPPSSARKYFPSKLQSRLSCVCQRWDVKFFLTLFFFFGFFGMNSLLALTCQQSNSLIYASFLHSSVTWNYLPILPPPLHPTTSHPTPPHSQLFSSCKDSSDNSHHEHMATILRVI